MKVKIRAKDVRFSLPVPLAMAGLVIRWIPDRMFEQLKANTPEPYCSLITKEYISMIACECLEILRENRGLEIIHVEASDGTFVSITL